jgi:hypothetical protein
MNSVKAMDGFFCGEVMTTVEDMWNGFTCLIVLAIGYGILVLIERGMKK